MKAQMRRFARAMPPVLLLAAVLAGSALAERPDDRAGPLGVGGVSATTTLERAVRPDDRPGLLGVGSIEGQSLTSTARPDDRDVRIGGGALDSELRSAPIRPDDRAGVRGPGARVATASVAASTGDPFEWGDAFLGAGTAFGLLMLVGALTLTLRSRRRVIVQ